MLLLALGGAFPSFTLAAEGEPEPWQVWHQTPATSVMERIDAFHLFLFWIMVGICTLVVALMAYVLFRYNAKRNPRPSRTTHNTVVEVVWTIVPVLILVAIAIPSFKLLYYSEVVPDAEMTLKVVGRQWYWEYQYPDHGNFTFASLLVPEEELQPGQPRLLTVDNPVVLPVDTVIRFQFTAGDVQHAWSLPASGVKRDAYPGRLNESWARFDREGVFYGQCSELCGTGHGYMPITVQVVSKARFAEWVEQARAEFASAFPPEQPSLQLTTSQVPEIERADQ
ncbi:cytochrome c oxidase subunit II [Virgifigura deserti]|uniref:cytochrome c oxidase subunit II n=1 Tax=Virgifigura deserti TaxID=2268457 RepID=UPI003CCB98C1